MQRLLRQIRGDGKSHLSHQFGSLPAGWTCRQNRRAETDGYFSGIDFKPVARIDLPAAVNGERDDWNASFGRKKKRPFFEREQIAVSGSCAFRKYDEAGAVADG